MKRILVLVLACIAVVPLGRPAAAATADLESYLLKDINAGRAKAGLGPLTSHAGLLSRARTHSSDMARVGSINHDGFADRVKVATPDPKESNGAPDDGFSINGACENVAMFRGSKSESEIASLIYNGWLNSAPHKHCMLDEGAKHTVAGLGVYKASDGSIWATLEAVYDKTLPTKPATPGKPAFATSDPCGRAVDAAALGGATVIHLTSTNSTGGTVSLRAVSIPSWATFTSKSGSKATGTLTAEPGLGGWLSDALGSSQKATIAARNASGVTTNCTITLPATLL